MDPREAFLFVRDIPYRIPLHREEPDHCCNGKHVVLKELLEGEGLTVRPRVCQYCWEDFPLPGELERRIPPGVNCLHLYLEARRKGDWYVVDATWDRGLGKVFFINHWEDNMMVAVYANKVFSPEESLELFEEDDNEYEGDKEALARFYREVNNWLDRIRNG
ncbi:MAG: hypothetical protein KAT43_02175 [Nanoarchaeota archaeon]|nr:hypothetical protein [Nanoarchaeota archaeon]